MKTKDRYYKILEKICEEESEALQPFLTYTIYEGHTDLILKAMEEVDRDRKVEFIPISVSDRLPTEEDTDRYGTVIAYEDHVGYIGARYDNGEWKDPFGNLISPQYWIPSHKEFKP